MPSSTHNLKHLRIFEFGLSVVKTVQETFALIGGIGFEINTHLDIILENPDALTLLKAQN
ncbi:MAG: hypothetical protein SPI12_05480 [Actinomycetaceae bacterium]|nr:hypothetical protein [Actinomycetaceae bacterium]MDY6083292.1 hypothetical protein [Actinomycetaceae bacterium]